MTAKNRVVFFETSSTLKYILANTMYKMGLMGVYTREGQRIAIDINGGISLLQIAVVERFEQLKQHVNQFRGFNCTLNAFFF